MVQPGRLQHCCKYGAARGKRHTPCPCLPLLNRRCGTRALLPQVDSLIHEGTRVEGVAYTAADGSRQRLLGSAVVLATGGFGASAQLLRKYAPQVRGWRAGCRHGTGCTAAGAHAWRARFAG